MIARKPLWILTLAPVLLAGGGCPPRHAYCPSSCLERHEVRGTVVDAATGYPVAYASVEVTADPPLGCRHVRCFRVDGSGRFRKAICLRHRCYPRRIQLSFSAPGYRTRLMDLACFERGRPRTIMLNPVYACYPPRHPPRCPPPWLAPKGQVYWTD